jgi:two-component system cell cycle response regulator
MPPAAVRIVLGILTCGLIAHQAHTLFGLGGPASEALFDRWIYTGLECAATALCIARACWIRADRVGWSLLAANMVFWTAGDLTWVVWLNGLEDPPVPSIADAFYYASYALMYAGVLVLLRARLRSLSAAAWLDGLIGGLTLAALCAVLLDSQLQASGDGLSLAVNLGYPISELVLLCFVGVAFGSMAWRPGRSWMLIGASLVLTALADSVYAYVESNGDYTIAAYSSWWPASFLAMGAAAWVRSERPSERESNFIAVLVPGVFSAVALGLLGYAALGRAPVVASVLAICALLMAGARAALTYAENLRLLRRSRIEALTDLLSGLGNRRQLIRDIERALAAPAGDPRTLVFFDLNGFKHYNDSFGHNAGDVLLARLGRRLGQAVAGSGNAYRLGGDEFCAVLDGTFDRDDPQVTAAVSALLESGEGFVVDASYGIVVLPDDADTATLALQLADERMYADKGARRNSPKRQARNLLLQILAEREPDLRRHMDEVATLATAVAREMGLEPEAVDEIARAAELHDIGKIAVPDAILDKAGSLDELEWELMRQHTIVGERILAAAPALKPVARLVRASHERWDGTGYPDRLAGDAIPLGARIVAVCDSFDAMTSDRAYRGAMHPDAAYAELRRCAGSQFDPAVVGAFIRASDPARRPSGRGGPWRSDPDLHPSRSTLE